MLYLLNRYLPCGVALFMAYGVATPSIAIYSAYQIPLKLAWSRTHRREQYGNLTPTVFAYFFLRYVHSSVPGLNTLQHVSLIMQIVNCVSSMGKLDLRATQFLCAQG